DLLRPQAVQVERKRQGIVSLGCPVISEMLAASFQVVADSVLHRARVIRIAVSDPLLEIAGSQVAGHRDAARDRQSVSLSPHSGGERDHPALKMPEGGRHTVALVSGADDDQPSHTIREPRTKSERYHSTVRRTDYSIHPADSGI